MDISLTQTPMGHSYNEEVIQNIKSTERGRLVVVKLKTQEKVSRYTYIESKHWTVYSSLFPGSTIHNNEVVIL